MSLVRPYPALLTLVLLLVASLAWASAAPAAPPVSVIYVHPASFDAMRNAPLGVRSDVQDDLTTLRYYIQRRAGLLLSRGQHLTIRINDVTLAGQYQPWPESHAGWVRVERSLYPPRMRLEFTLLGADGTVLRHGKRKLTKHGYMGNSRFDEDGPVVYAESMVNRWLRKGADKL